MIIGNHKKFQGIRRYERCYKRLHHIAPMRPQLPFLVCTNVEDIWRLPNMLKDFFNSQIIVLCKLVPNSCRYLFFLRTIATKFSICRTTVITDARKSNQLFPSQQENQSSDLVKIGARYSNGLGSCNGKRTDKRRKLKAELSMPTARGHLHNFHQILLPYRSTILPEVIVKIW